MRVQRLTSEQQLEARQVVTRVNEWCAELGGHMRTGLEDNMRLDKNTLAPSNAALVKRAVQMCEKYERPVATYQQAREILGLRAA